MWFSKFLLFFLSGGPGRKVHTLIDSELIFSLSLLCLFVPTVVNNTELPLIGNRISKSTSADTRASSDRVGSREYAGPNSKRHIVLPMLSNLTKSRRASRCALAVP